MLRQFYRRWPEPLKNVARRTRSASRRLASSWLGMDAYESLVPRLIRDLRIDHVLDVGAHEGAFGRMLRHLGYRGTIDSFEPVADHFAALQRTARGDGMWRTHPFALGDIEGSREIQVAAIGQFSSFLPTSDLSRRTFGAGSAPVRAESVRIRRLDGVMPEVLAGAPGTARCFLKMDTQGYDLKVLAGAGDRIEAILLIQSEISVQPLYDGMPSDLTSIAAMRGLGFEVSGLFPVDRDRDGCVLEFDILMRRKAG